MSDVQQFRLDVSPSQQLKIDELRPLLSRPDSRNASAVRTLVMFLVCDWDDAAIPFLHSDVIGGLSIEYGRLPQILEQERKMLAGFASKADDPIHSRLLKQLDEIIAMRGNKNKYFSRNSCRDLNPVQSIDAQCLSQELDRL